MASFVCIDRSYPMVGSHEDASAGVKAFCQENLNFNICKTRLSCRSACLSYNSLLQRPEVFYSLIPSLQYKQPAPPTLPKLCMVFLSSNVLWYTTSPKRKPPGSCLPGEGELSDCLGQSQDSTQSLNSFYRVSVSLLLCSPKLTFTFFFFF